MDQLTTSQIKMLKSISKASPLAYTSLSEHERSTCDFLKDLGYISFSTVSRMENKNGCSQFWEETESVSVTELGKAYLAWLHTDKFRFTVPNLINAVLSIIAIIISLFALLKP